MARRRVFKTRAERPGIGARLGITSYKLAIVGRTVTFERVNVEFPEQLNSQPAIRRPEFSTKVPFDMVGPIAAVRSEITGQHTE
jgi:hypothetical protein